MRKRHFIVFMTLALSMSAMAADTAASDSGAMDTAVYDTGGRGASYLAGDTGGCYCQASATLPSTSLLGMLALVVVARRRR